MVSIGVIGLAPFFFLGEVIKHKAPGGEGPRVGEVAIVFGFSGGGVAEGRWGDEIVGSEGELHSFGLMLLLWKVGIGDLECEFIL